MVALLHPEPANPSGRNNAFATRKAVSPPRPAGGARSRTDHRGRADLVLVVDNTRPSASRLEDLFGWLLPVRSVLEAPISSFGARSSMLAGVNLSVGAVAGLVVSLLLLLGLSGPVAGAVFGAEGSGSAVGSSGAAGWQALASEPGPGEAVIVAVAGDSLWSIAVQRFPEHDPRFVVDTLAARNGGERVAVGQPVVVPVTLVG